MIATVSAALAVAMAVSGAEPDAPQPVDSNTLELLRNDLLRSDDGGTKARAAADQAAQAGRGDLLLLGVTNCLHDVRIHSLKLLRGCALADQVMVLNAALTTPALWLREQKIGELIVSQEQVASTTAAVIHAILKQPDSAASDLLDPAVRERLAGELRAALSARLKTDALKWDDGGTAARAACDLAVKFQDVSVLIAAVGNPLFDVKRYAVQHLPKLDRAQQVAALQHILRDEPLWVRERKIGELIVSQERFASDIRTLLASLLKRDLQNADLFSANTRTGLAAQLSAK